MAAVDNPRPETTPTRDGPEISNGTNMFLWERRQETWTEKKTKKHCIRRKSSLGKVQVDDGHVLITAFP